MRFRDYIENTRPITDFWPINKSMYDLTTDRGRKEYESDVEFYSDIHRKVQADKLRKLVSTQRKSEPYVITCWRGFDKRSLERDTVEQGNGYRVLHGKSAMESILWFTHSLQGSIEPEQYARSHAEDYLITYPLQAVKHYDLVTYDNGKTEMKVPAEMQGMDGSQKSRFMPTIDKVYEVPEGWFFTWQVQKHLGCSVPLKIMDSMIEMV
jgi:hypothetical protein